MSRKSRLRTALRRTELTQDAVETRAYIDVYEPDFIDPKTGIARWYTPASQRDTPAYPSKNKPAPKYAKDKFGVTDAYRTNRKDRRRGLR